jgi:hypothetical protein
MCFGSKPKPVKAPVVQPAPSRDEVAEAAGQERRRVRQQQGVYGNVFTSVLGDPTYNSNVQRPANQAVASLGA